MPSLPEMKAGEVVYVAGFGRTLSAKMSPVKQKLRIPIYDHTQCLHKFATKNVEVTDSQICAGGEFGRDACDGGEFVANSLRTFAKLICHNRLGWSTHALQRQLDRRGRCVIRLSLRPPRLAGNLHESLVVHRVDRQAYKIIDA
jgi:Trypsin